MKSFKNHSISEDSVPSKNIHMEHLESAVIKGGTRGCRDAISALISLRDMLQGNVNAPIDVTLKWDGSVSIVCGIDPSDGEFFVAKKSIFNKNPIVYKSVKEIRDDKSGDLADKLEIAYTELKPLGIKNIIQGDIMFTKTDVIPETIEGEKYITFQPNTIVYAIPVESDLALQIKKANIGIVFHTTYSGSSFESMSASYKVDLSKLKLSSSAWIRDASIRDLSGQVTLTRSETAELNATIARAGSIFQKISSSTLKELESNQEFAATIEVFDNTLIRAGTVINNTSTHVDNLIAWATARHDEKIASMKSEKGKADASNRKDVYMSFFSDENKKNLDLLYQLYNTIVKAKLIIINKLDTIKKMNTFLKTKDGFKVTGNEGFVVIDHLKGGAMKLVDRMSFSHANFSPDIIHGWSK